MIFFGAGYSTGYAVFILTALVSLSAAVVCSVSAVRFIRRRIKLNHSIRLVELRTTRIHYYIFLAADVALMLPVVFMPMGGFSREIQLLTRGYGLSAWQMYAVLGFLGLLTAAFAFLLVALIVSKAAVVDKGVYTSLDYLDWYHVHDYIIDERDGTVILSTSRDTFSTLRGTTMPLKVKKDDIPKLKFILNKNKNKFSGA